MALEQVLNARSSYAPTVLDIGTGKCVCLPGCVCVTVYVNVYVCACLSIHLCAVYVCLCVRVCHCLVAVEKLSLPDLFPSVCVSGTSLLAIMAAQILRRQQQQQQQQQRSLLCPHQPAVVACE